MADFRRADFLAVGAPFWGTNPGFGVRPPDFWPKKKVRPRPNQGHGDDRSDRPVIFLKFGEVRRGLPKARHGGFPGF